MQILHECKDNCNEHLTRRRTYDILSETTHTIERLTEQGTFTLTTTSIILNVDTDEEKRQT